MTGLTQYKTPWSAIPIFSSDLDIHGFPVEKRMQIVNCDSEVIAVAKDAAHATLITSAIQALAQAQNVIKTSEEYVA
jgi:hypothetical protein